jgi:hypothetical protein
MGSLYRSAHELVFVFKNGKDKHKNNVQLGQFGRYHTNVWSYPGVNSFARKTDEGNLLELHPIVKPVALVADAIMDVSGFSIMSYRPRTVRRNRLYRCDEQARQRAEMRLRKRTARLGLPTLAHPSNRAMTASSSGADSCPNSLRISF